MNSAEFQKAQIVLRENPGQYTWARCIKCNDPATHFVQEDKDEFTLFCDRHAPDYAESFRSKGAIIPGDRAMPSHPAELIEAFLPDNLADTIDKLSGPGFAQLRKTLTKSFGIRLQSTGTTPNVELTRVILQTIGATPANPYLITFDQIILDPFTGDGQFDLVERESRRRSYGGASAGGTPILTDLSGVMNWQSSDEDEAVKVGANPGQYYKIVSRQSTTQVTLDRNITLPSSGLTLTMDGSDDSKVTIATKAGFTDGDTTGSWSRFLKPITSDKFYSVVFVPGDTGDGIYSLNIQGLKGK